MSDDMNAPQPEPVGEGDIVLYYVQSDILARAAMGRRKYGTFLRAQNGRDALVDAYQEAIDLVMYLRQHCMDMEIRNRALARLLSAILDWINEDEEHPMGADKRLIRAFQDTRALLDGREWDEYPEMGQGEKGDMKE